MVNEGNNKWCNGYIDGCDGREVASDHPDYQDGYGRGYATSEVQSAIAIQNEKRRHKN